MSDQAVHQVFKVISANELSGKHIGKRISIAADGFRYGGVVSHIEHFDNGEVSVTVHQPVETPSFFHKLYSELTHTLVTHLGGDTRIVTPHDD